MIMRVQSVVLPGDICEKEEIFVRKSGNIQFCDNQIKMAAGSGIKFDTYMNLFDADRWGRYTGMFWWRAMMELRGSGEIRLVRWNAGHREVVSRHTVHSDKWTEHSISFQHNETKSMYYLEADAKSGFGLKDIRFETDGQTDQRQNEVKLGLIICTYHRERELYQNLDTIYGSAFFDPADDLYGKLTVYVVDNASELPAPDRQYVKWYHNENTGGSGGFTRGIEEIRREKEETGISNVIFMDDDAKLLAETLYRLYALLSLADEAHSDSVVAGRMFRLDQKEIQYTAAEIWNRGDIRHVGWNLDMSLAEHLLRMNDNDGAEYGGWWFCCFPVQFVMENDPVQFFIHCDDVEYGLRSGKQPVILNGIQVWHETYEKRQSPVMAYYDTRNPMIVNAIHGLFGQEADYIGFWKKSISAYHVRGDYLSEFMAIKAMKDFVAGAGKLNRKSTCVKVPPECLRGRKLRVWNALCWRGLDLVLKKGLGRAVKKYRDQV